MEFVYTYVQVGKLEQLKDNYLNLEQIYSA